MLDASRAALLDWFDRHARDLPWRRTRDPYAVWVSEVMLQQTRVETVIPYYARFLERFPDARSLAGASDDDVLSLWSGLGYYRRARLLLAGVRDVVARYGAEVPRDAEARRGLPGIGRYTAGAIGSIAFDLPEPIVDGNVARVLARLHRIESPLGRADTEKRLWDEASRWADGPRPGALNQALMELGATVCTKASPKCETCPLAFACRARKDGVAAKLPVPRAKKAPVPKSLVALVVASDEPDPEVVVVRSGDALFGGLFGMPMVDDGEADLAKLLRAHRLEAKLEPSARGTIEHVLSHRRLSVRVVRGALVRATTSDEVRVMRVSSLGTVGVARLTWKILEAAGLTSTDAPSGATSHGSRDAARAKARKQASGRASARSGGARRGRR